MRLFFLNNKCHLHYTMLVNTIHYMRCGRNRITFHIFFHVLHNCGIFSITHVSDFISSMLFNDTVLYMVTSQKRQGIIVGCEWQNNSTAEGWSMRVYIYKSWSFMIFNFFFFTYCGIKNRNAWKVAKLWKSRNLVIGINKNQPLECKSACILKVPMILKLKFFGFWYEYVCLTVIYKLVCFKIQMII